MLKERINETLLSGGAFINRCTVQGTNYHSHNFVEIAYVAKGEGTHTVNGKVFEAKAGNITLINYDIPHKFTSADEKLIVYNCIFTPGYFDSVFAASRNFFDVSSHFLLGNFFNNDFQDYINVEAEAGDNAHILNIFERMLHECENKPIGYKEIMRGYLIELLVLIFRLQMHTSPDKSQKIQGVLDYISIHFRRDIRVEELAALCNMSTTHFCRIFKELTGTTVTSYIQALRIDEACRLLHSTDKNVIEIAGDVGYSDMKHFYGIFKKITGKLPKDFR